MNTATATRISRIAHGQVECLNCGRTLATALRRLSDGAIRLVHATDGELAVELLGGSRLRCTRCGGRAFLEFEQARAA